MRLLLIEDDAFLRDIIAKRLKAEGYTVDSCTNGESGYDYASGLEVLKRLRSEGNKSPHH